MQKLIKRGKETKRNQTLIDHSSIAKSYVYLSSNFTYSRNLINIQFIGVVSAPSGGKEGWGVEVKSKTNKFDTSALNGFLKQYTKTEKSFKNNQIW